MSIGKKLGILSFIAVEIIIAISLFLARREDIIMIVYAQVTVFSIIWGAKSYSNYTDMKKMANGNGQTMPIQGQSEILMK